MLNSMRSSRKILSIVLWIVIIAFVSTIFVVWGIGSRENQATFVAKIGDDTITYEEYRTFYDNTVQQLRSMFGDAYDEYAKTQDMDALVLRELTDRKLMLIEAKRLGIPASDFEVIEAIKAVPAFQNEQGQFDPERYVQTLNYFRQTPAVFEASVRDDILVAKFQSLVRNAQYAVSEEAVMSEYNYRYSTAQVSYFSVPVSSFTPAQGPTDEALAAYYEENKESYRVPAKIKLKYVIFDKNAYTPEDITVSEDEIKAYYDANISSYVTQDSVVMRNIAVGVSNWNDEEEVKKARAKIDEAMEALKKPGADFIDVVRKYADPLVASNDGLVGRVHKGQLQPDFEAAVFATEPGAFTDVLKAEYGFHIIKVDEKTPAKTYTIDEKRGEITDAIKNNKKNDSFRNYVISLYKGILEAGNITAYIKAKPESGLTVASTEFFPESEAAMPVFLSKPDALKNIFTLSKTELSQLVEDGTVTYLFEVEDKIASEIPTLDKVKEQVVAAYNRSQALKTAVADIEKSLADSSFADAAKNFKAEIVKPSEFSRFQPDLTLAPSFELIAAVFDAEPGKTLPKAYVIGDNVYAVNVENIIPPSSDNYDKEKDAITSYIRSIKEEEAIISYIDSLRAKTKIEVNPAFINGGQN